MLLASVLAAGCSGGDPGEPDAAPLVRCPLGDASSPVELEIVHLDREYNVIATVENAEVPLQAPPQGGWIVLLGTRATNLDGCNLTLTTSFRDIANNDVIKVDRRPTDLMPTGDGWGVTTTQAFGNLPICPQVTSLRDLHGQPYIVTVELEDLDGKRASKDVTIVPVCPVGVGLCDCECDKDYVLGNACEPPAFHAER
ncbi:MAG: hypothetical protein H0X17_08635 [Deltaproteobacteria bacterium]|nr:hypothetical protein [Deltaproteobacteria bacterium]